MATLKRPKGRRTSRWSNRVSRTSNALDLEEAVFKQSSAAKIAASLKRSADASKRRKGTPFQSAMSMLNFYINRGGLNLSKRRKAILLQAKVSLRQAYHRDA
jgi:hypothetical protein